MEKSWPQPGTTNSTTQASCFSTPTSPPSFAPALATSYPASAPTPMSPAQAVTLSPPASILSPSSSPSQHFKPSLASTQNPNSEVSSLSSQIQNSEAASMSPQTQTSEVISSSSQNQSPKAFSHFLQTQLPEARLFASQTQCFQTSTLSTQSQGSEPSSVSSQNQRYSLSSQSSAHSQNPLGSLQSHSPSQSSQMSASQETESSSQQSDFAHSSNSVPSGYEMVEEVTAVRVPMLQPNPRLMRILQACGGIGETFTLGEIINLLRKYIGDRELYDKQDPRIVYCEGDDLEGALNVKTFTITEAVALYQRNCRLEPDSCFRIRRQLVMRPVATQSSAKPVVPTATTARESSACHVTPSQSRTAPVGQQADEVLGVKATAPSSAGRTDSTCNFPTTASGSSVTISPQELASCQISSSSDSEVEDKTGQRKKWDKRSTGQGRSRQLSVSVSYDDEPDGMPGPSVAVTMETNTGEASNRNSSAFKKEEALILEYDSDTFSVEYEVESSSENEVSGHDHSSKQEEAISESEVSSSDSGNAALLLVCTESDIEYLADYSDSDSSSDTEIPEDDKWQCSTCAEKNLPFHRNCGHCWTVRPGWLPPSQNLNDGAAKTPDGAAKTPGNPFDRPSAAEKKDVEAKPKPSHTAAKKRRHSPCLESSEEKGEGDSGAAAGPSMGKKRPPREKVKDPCVVCMVRTKSASIIHGKTGHQVCCFHCAKRLKKLRKSCPVCRKPIQKVIHNYCL